MYEQRFYHEVLGPTLALLNRAAENVCVGPDFSDVIALAKQAAGAAYHFREPVLRRTGADRVPPMQDANAEGLRQRLCDCVDSAKHGMLKIANRVVSFSAGLAFEHDPDKGYRYLRTEVRAINKRWGEFELSDTIQAFLKHLIDELDIELEMTISLPSHPFREWAETYLTHKSGPAISSTRVLIYRREDDGRLSPIDLPEVKFRILR